MVEYIVIDRNDSYISVIKCKTFADVRDVVVDKDLDYIEVFEVSKKVELRKSVEIVICAPKGEQESSHER